MMCSNSEHVIDVFRTHETIGHRTDNFPRRRTPSTTSWPESPTTRLEHMFDINV